MIKVSKLGVSGDYLPEFFSGSQSATVNSGNSVILTPPSGKYIKLENLAVGSAGLTLPDVSVTVGSTLVVQDKILGFANSTDQFIVGTAVANGTSAVSSVTGSIPFIRGFAPDESITISCSDVTGGTIYYSYSYGDLY